MACGTSVPPPGIEPSILGTESRVITTGPPGNSHQHVNLKGTQTFSPGEMLSREDKACGLSRRGRWMNGDTDLCRLCLQGPPKPSSGLEFLVAEKLWLPASRQDPCMPSLRLGGCSPCAHPLPGVWSPPQSRVGQGGLRTRKRKKEGPVGVASGVLILSPSASYLVFSQLHRASGATVPTETHHWLPT